MKRRTIQVRFVGTVEVAIPDHVPNADADTLANKLVLTRIIATTDNPDAPEEDALNEYLAEASDRACEDDWDRAMTLGVGGTWTTEQE